MKRRAYAPDRPDTVSEYVHAQISGSTLVRLKATGHCPNLYAPEETVAAMADFLKDPDLAV